MLQRPVRIEGQLLNNPAPFAAALLSRSLQHMQGAKSFIGAADAYGVRSRTASKMYPQPSRPHQSRVRAGDQAQDNATLAVDEAFLPGERVVFATDRVVPQPGGIGFVGGQVGDGVVDVCRRAGALVRREIADQAGAAARDRLTPVAGLALEGLHVERVDLVADAAGDHRALPGPTAGVRQVWLAALRRCFGQRRSL